MKINKMQYAIRAAYNSNQKLRTCIFSTKHLLRSNVLVKIKLVTRISLFVILRNKMSGKQR